MSRVARQQEFGFSTWGGRRPGAGRKPAAAHAGVAHLTRPALAPRFPVHVTWRMDREVWNLRSRRCFSVMQRAMYAGALRFGFRLVHYAVMGNHVHLIVEALNTRRKALNGSRVHIFGMAYKPNVGDVRESPALDILELLIRQGAVVTYTDPYVESLVHGDQTLRSATTEDALAQSADCYVICTNHDVFDYDTIVKRAALIVDTRNALKQHASQAIVRL